ncbi:MAG: Dihydroorotase [candidate division WS2 bacterium]|uniref:Dihydroorotase n=1 Tax=Psychracetigena formicireducens TaxID=2986056 RepID=A0A9E2F7G7_PSYF1|nr:Dihydroorotase [Candidatus Psychracetigena formicireducens]MBT9145558.1 Dihydroorotase [Candidatus Psychracetigena formicireducens]
MIVAVEPTVAITVTNSSKYNWHFKNISLVDSFTQEEGGLWVENGIITDKPSANNDYHLVDGKGLLLMPAFIDLHAHFREPGFTYKEDMLSGCNAGAKGGFTAISLMPNTSPVLDKPEFINDLKKKYSDLLPLDIFYTASITEGQEGKKVVDFDNLSPLVWAFSDDGKGVDDPEVFQQALIKARDTNKTLLLHEEVSLAQMPLFSKNICPELWMVKRDLEMNQKIKASLHLTHLSNPQSIKMVDEAHKKSQPVTCDVTPHHLCLNMENFPYKVNPPLVNESTRKSLLELVRQGMVNAIATDHAPHSDEDKEKEAPGINNLELTFATLNNFLIRKGQITLPKLSFLLSLGPARILGISAYSGLLRNGFQADLVVIDPNRKSAMNINSFVSKSHNTPLLDYPLFGWPLLTLKKGEVVYNSGIIN